MSWKRVIGCCAVLILSFGCGGGGTSSVIPTLPSVMPSVPEMSKPAPSRPVPTTPSTPTTPSRVSPNTDFSDLGPWMNARGFSYSVNAYGNPSTGLVTMNFDPSPSAYYKGDEEPVKSVRIASRCGNFLPVGGSQQGFCGVPYKTIDEFYIFNGKVAGYHRSDGLVEGGLRIVFGASDDRLAHTHTETRFINGEERDVQVVDEYIFDAYFSGISGLPSSIHGGVIRKGSEPGRLNPNDANSWYLVSFHGDIHMNGHFLGSNGRKAAGGVTTSTFTGLWEASRQTD